MTTDLTALRENYDRDALDETNIEKNPTKLFETWLNSALSQKLPEPYAMTLSTCGSDMKPSARTVLLRGYTDGFVFYTNYESSKGKDLAENPYAELLFFWHALEQQVRISGRVEKLSEVESTNYYHKRPHDSQLGAWVSSPQSGEVASRIVMEDKFAELKNTYPEDTTVPKPDFWGGYKLLPECFEFWQGRPNRMHDRLIFTKNNQENTDVTWEIKRLLP